MSTRCTTHFVYGNRLTAIVYRHSDGYPDGAGKDLLKFFEECSKLQDSRFGDPSYLAAKYVVFLAQMFSVDYVYDEELKKYNEIPKKNRLEFLSVGIVMEDPGDIDYRYVVDCSELDPKTGFPKLKCIHKRTKAEVSLASLKDEG